jgi:ribonuclease Z
MRPSFIVRLVNGPLFDPIVYLRLINENRAIMFDCGRFSGISNKELLLLDAVFVTHMHMDHFVGFDSLLRVILHREKPLNVFGPEGIIDKLISKLNSYTWNLTSEYPLTINITEVLKGSLKTVSLRASSGFSEREIIEGDRSGNEIYADPRFTVESVILDHNIPCMAFAVKEKFHVNIRPDIIEERGFIPGPWIGQLKEMIISGVKGDIEIETKEGKVAHSSALLAEDISVITKGQKIAYLADVRFSQDNLDSFKTIAAEADVLFIETFYLEEMKDEAYIKGHLTAAQAGEVFNGIKAKRIVPMHVSPRYHNRVDEVFKEAGCVCPGLSEPDGEENP